MLGIARHARHALSKLRIARDYKLGHLGPCESKFEGTEPGGSV